MSAATPLELVERWVAAWVRARDLGASRLHGWPFVLVQAPSRETELVCVTPDAEELARLARHLQGDPRAMLTVAAPHGHGVLAGPLPSGVRVDRDDEVLMTVTLAAVPAPDPPPADLHPRWDVVGDRATYLLEAADSVAAQGTVGLLGRDAVLDEVETMPGFRRRGLATHVTRTLAARARNAGAEEGLLVATAGGRALYAREGWQTRLALVSLMGAG